MSFRKANMEYDLWAETSDKNLHTISNAKTSLRKKKQPQYTPSIVSSVQIPHEGASYNPPVDSYVEYAKSIAKAESKLLLDDKRTKVAMKMATSSKLETENFKEEFHVFRDALYTKNKLDDDFFKKEEVMDDVEETPESASAGQVKRKQPKGKTLKQKRDAQIRRLVSGLNDGNVQKKISEQLQSVKSLTKEVRKKIAAHEANLARRRKVHAIRKLTGKRRLGRGNFENFVDPVMLPNEFRGTLRSVHQHSDVLKERLNSFQRRNILPTPGKNQRALKMSMRAKIVEKRSVKAITENTKVI